MKIQRTRWLRPVVHIQIAAQIGAALLPFYAGSVRAADAVVDVESTSADAQNDKLKQTLAEQLSTFGNSAASGNAADAVAQQVTGGVTKATEDWLKRFGTARIDLNYTDKFNIDSGAIDLLLPLADSESRLLFTQIGVRKKDAQVTGNVGIGQRHFTGDWMFGYNAFYDQNLTRGHQRAGIGGEAWRDFLKLSANSYLRISDWKASPDVIDYDERPANGFDLRAEGWLPSMPSLGGKLMYEQYFGSDVGLAGITNRQSNPKAWTLGVNYTPIPMLTIGLDHKRGGGTGDTKIGLQLNYALGESWSKQTDASKVAQRRSVAGSRYDLVERNNNIVLEYRKQQMVKLELPKEIVGKSNKTLALAYTVEAKYGMQRMDWQHAELSAAGGTVNHMGNNQFQITLPAYQAGGNNTYPLSAVATDTKGNSGAASSIVRVNAPDVSVSNSVVTASPTAVLADGKSNSIVKIELRDEDNNAIAGMTADLAVPLTETLQASQVLAPNLPLQPATISVLQETSAGIYEAVVTAGTRVGSIAVAPVFREVALTPVTITEGADAASAHIADGAMTVTVDNSIANQAAANQIRAIVTDAGGNSLAGLTVTFTLGGSAIIAAGSSLTPTTDASGAVTIGFTDAAAEAVTVSATLANGSSAKVTTQFIADTSSAQIGSGDLTVDKTTVIANNADAATYSAIVKDANGNLVPNISVNWATNLGNLPATSSNTDANGRATISLTGTIAGIAQVTAKVGASAPVNAPAVTFTADSSSGGIGSGDLTVDKTTVIANNTDAATFAAIVKDANGNPVSNTSVNWSTNLGNLSAANSTTDANGRATIVLTGTIAGAAQVSAQTGTSAAANAPVVTFTADSSSGTIGSGDLTVDKTTVIANNTDAAIYSAIVKDANGNVVPNISVSWGTNHGNLSAASSATDVNGRATIRLTGAIVGAAQVTAAVNAGAPVNAPVVNFIADSGSGSIGSGDLTVDKTTVIANNTDAAIYSAIVKDANGNLVPNISVSWGTDRGNLSAASSTTDANGVATIRLTGTTAGAAQVTAAVNAGAAVNAPVVNFIADSGSGSIGGGDLTVDKTTVIANNTDAAIYSAIVKDANGNLVPNISVSWNSDRGNLSATSSTTDANGLATIRLTGAALGAAQVTAQVNTGAAVNAPVVDFIADVATATITAVTSAKARITGNGAETNTVTATVADALGHPIADAVVNWTTSLGDLSGTTSVTGSTGSATIELTAMSTATANPTANVTAEINSSTRSSSTQVRAVILAGGRHYWTMQSDHDTNVEATAVSNCSIFGNGTVATLADLNAFAAAGADFATMAVAGEYANNWWNLGGTWTTLSGDFHSAGAPVGATGAGAGTAYVCVR